MPVTLTPAYRALAMGGAAAAVLIGVFALGIGAGNNAARPSAGQHSPGTNAGALLTSSTGSARITVTGTGTVNGTPSQLVLSIGVQVNAASVGSALTEANQAVSRVTAVLKAGGVAAPDIQTSDLYIQPSFRGGSQTPDGYGVSESLNATLRRLSVAGAEIDDAVRAGGNAATVDGISLNLTDTSSLLATRPGGGGGRRQGQGGSVRERPRPAPRARREHHRPGSLASLPPVCGRLGSGAACFLLRADLAGHPAAQRLGHRRVRHALTRDPHRDGTERPAA